MWDTIKTYIKSYPWALAVIVLLLVVICLGIGFWWQGRVYQKTLSDLTTRAQTAAIQAHKAEISKLLTSLEVARVEVAEIEQRIKASEDKRKALAIVRSEIKLPTDIESLVTRFKEAGYEAHIR